MASPVPPGVALLDHRGNRWGVSEKDVDHVDRLHRSEARDPLTLKGPAFALGSRWREPRRRGVKAGFIFTGTARSIVRMAAGSEANAMRIPRRRFLHMAAGAAALPAASSIAGAQTYPSRPITIVVGFAAGAATDTIARINC